MSETLYEREWKRQLERPYIPPEHLPVHRWYLEYSRPWEVEAPTPPREGLSIIRAHNPTIEFYRFLYHTAGEEYLWGDRRRISDADLLPMISPDTIHVMVLYLNGVPAGFFELDTSKDELINVKYFALLPGFKGMGLGSFMLNSCIHLAGQMKKVPLTLDTCTLDHPFALENYSKRGFMLIRSEDEIYPDPRLDGTVPPESGKHVPAAQQ